MRRLVIALAVALSTQAMAAEIYTEQQGEFAWMLLRGKIEPGDELKFAEKAGLASNGHVTLESPGGNLYAAVQIGEMISKRFTTTAGEYCYSSCALIWLAGKHRFVLENSKVGFHAAYYDDGKVTAPGNAMIGAYASKLGLSYAAIHYITSAMPEAMTPPLTVKKAKELGIEMCLSPFQQCTSQQAELAAREHWATYIAKRADQRPAKLPQSSMFGALFQPRDVTNILTFQPTPLTLAPTHPPKWPSPGPKREP